MTEDNKNNSNQVQVSQEEKVSFDKDTFKGNGSKTIFSKKGKIAMFMILFIFIILFIRRKKNE